MKITGILAVLFCSFGTGISAFADSNPTITEFVDALSGHPLVCTASNGNVIHVKSASRELEMSARFATEGHEADNDDGPSNCTGKVCTISASTDSDSGDMAIVDVSTTSTDQTELDLNFGDDNQNDYVLDLPGEAISDLDQGKSFSANGVYSRSAVRRFRLRTTARARSKSAVWASRIFLPFHSPYGLRTSEQSQGERSLLGNCR